MEVCDQCNQVADSHGHNKKQLHKGMAISEIEKGEGGRGEGETGIIPPQKKSNILITVLSNTDQNRTQLPRNAPIKTGETRQVFINTSPGTLQRQLPSG